MARENARSHGVASRIRFFEGDLFEPLEELDIGEQADIIVSNPPYISSGDSPALQPEVRDHEPSIALFAGPDGTEVHRRIIEKAPRFLNSKGRLIMEMGLGQAATLRRMIQDTGEYDDSPRVLKDLAGIERVTVARKK